MGCLLDKMQDLVLGGKHVKERKELSLPPILVPSPEEHLNIEQRLAAGRTSAGPLQPVCEAVKKQLCGKR